MSRTRPLQQIGPWMRTFSLHSRSRRVSLPIRRSPSLVSAQRRSYMYRLVNHQRLLMSLNALRTMMRSPMFYYQIMGVGVFAAWFAWYHSERTPISGRKRFNIVSEHWEKQLAKKYLKDEMAKNQDKILSTDSDQHRSIQRIFNRLIQHTDFARESWKIHIVSSPKSEAYVLPGGQVFMHTGMLDLCAREDEIAMVLGHEIMHNLMHHTSEGLSRLIPILCVDFITSLVSGLDADLVGLATDVAFRLPRSRVQETEADYFGLLLAAKSGYDPAAAEDLWARWDNVEDCDRPEYLGTHPSHRNRSLQFHSWLVEARKKRLGRGYEVDDFEDVLALQRSYCGIDRYLDVPAEHQPSTVAA